MPGFIANSGRITIENTSGDLVFDTDEGLFVVTDRVTGTISTPQRTATNPSGGNNHRSVNVDHAITSVNAAADTVRGVFQVSFANATGVPGFLGNLGAFNAGGSYLHWLGGIASPSNEGNPVYDPHELPGQMLVYTFIASGGSLFLREQAQIQAQPSFFPVTTSITFRAPTFDYDLFVGTFV